MSQLPPTANHEVQMHVSSRWTSPHPVRRVAASALLTLLVSQPVVPATITVDGSCSLVDAITAANTDLAVGACASGDPGSDTIALTVDTTLVAIDNSEDGKNGLPSVTSEIRVDGGGFSVVRDPSAPDFRIVHIADGAKLELRDLGVANGSASPGASGGAIFNAGALVLTNVTVSDSVAREGGGIYNSYDKASAVLTDTTVAGNYATGSGGGIENNRGLMTFDNTTLSGNTANSGGGLATGRGTVTLTNTTVSGNSASSGGGINTNDSVTTLVNTTVTGNTAYKGGGIYANDDPAILYGTIVADNRAYIGEGPNCGGNHLVTDGGSNFSDDASCGAGFATITPGVDFDTALAHSGGSTRIHALLLGSVAVDAAGACGLVGDQRGVPRDDAACDSGPYELALPELTVGGTCPGPVTLTATIETAGGTVRLLGAKTEGSATLPAGPCAGTQLRLASPRLLATGQADAEGRISMSITLFEPACGVLLQAFDETTCTPTLVAGVP